MQKRKGILTRKTIQRNGHVRVFREKLDFPGKEKAPRCSAEKEQRGS